MRNLARPVVLLVTFALLLAPSLAAAAQNGTADESLTWATFTQNPEPIFTGQYIASDPSIVVDADGTYRMTYTCYVVDLTNGFNPDDVRAAICEATSTDGLAWTELPVDGDTPGLVLRGREGEWDENLEASEIIATGDGYLLYASGYRHEGNPALGYPAALEAATSADGVTFERVSDDPILAPTSGWYDNDAVYSPSIIPVDNGYLMVYAGHCYTDCDLGPGVRLLAATSDDGIAWQKRDDPVLETIPDLAWTKDGVAEPALVPGPDGRYYLFFTGLMDEDRNIGVAVSDSPFGPWQVNPEPVITQSSQPGAFDGAGVLAPFVRIEGDVVRVWYLGMTPDEAIAIGYAEASWPLVVP